ncbi:CueP family metal-binding protein [Microbacterium aurugineum]|uniref:CueP family metal-binding protein n=1 Tax=Microbacterium aurugineum TaxID=2851642 RepID=UPI0020C155D9|nr:CueP family metal-binding protein [Microbacterium aurugineum]MCK8477838.1 CueP family metal-binding protein [Microbacterium aurugineum]
MNQPLRTTTTPVLSTSRRRRRKPSTAFAALAVAAIALAGCAASPAPTDIDSAAQEILVAHDLSGLDVGDVIERLDAMPVADRPTDLLASVEPDELVLRDMNGREGRLPLPDDAVYISVAPFRDRTHECHFHSLTTCIGELSDTEVRITLTAADGTGLIDETRRTQDNGFTGLWVPRGIEATLSIESAGFTGAVPLSTTSPDDRTCITDLQLL